MEFNEKVIGCMQTMESLNSVFSDMSEEVESGEAYTGLANEADAKDLAEMLQNMADALAEMIGELARYLTWERQQPEKN